MNAGDVAEAVTLSMPIARPWRLVYDAIWRPEVFPQWASGLAKSKLVADGDVWGADGPEGRVHIRFTDYNAFGVMDHRVTLPDGQEVDVPMRVVAHGEGAEILVTVFRRPGMSDGAFAADCDWVRRDLQVLRKLLAQG